MKKQIKRTLLARNHCKIDNTVQTMRDNREGITLVALVITIIILLILAGITINLTIGQRGILNRAQDAGKNYQEAARREDEQLSNFLKEADDIIDGINGGGTTPTTPEISEAVKGLKAGNYIKYDTGVSTVGENGVIVCRVLYPVDSQYGLQIISDKNVGDNVTLGDSAKTWETGKNAYQGAIAKLNSEAEKYVNTEYAYDGRCVGSIPTVKNGMFVDKNRRKDDEGNIRDTLNTVSIPEEYPIPTGWTSRDTGCYDTDTNCTIDEAALEGNDMWTTGQSYWLASCKANSSSTSPLVVFAVKIMSGVSSLSFDPLCDVANDGSTLGYLGSGSIGLRPCISLKSNTIRITGGDGTSPETAYTIGK